MPNERAPLPRRPQPDRRESSIPDDHIIDRIRRERERQQEDRRPHAPPPEPPGQHYEDPDDARKRREKEEDPDRDRGVTIIDM